MKYFVTGATGFIGGCLLRQLLDAGHKVNALVRNPSQAEDLGKMGVVLSSGDITEKESLRGPMKVLAGFMGRVCRP